MYRLMLIMWGALIWTASAQAASWHQVGFPGSRVSMVSVSPANANLVAATVDGQLQISLDGGVIWRPSSLPTSGRQIAFDPLNGAILYAGTDRGIYRSSDLGLSWQPFGSDQIRFQISLGAVVTPDGVITLMYNGAGTPVYLYRIGRNGATTQLGFYPGSNPTALVYDQARSRLYIGWPDGVAVSTDQGDSWAVLPAGSGHGTRQLAEIDGVIWQQSSSGLFRSTDDGAHWNQMAGPGELNGTTYGINMATAGLVADQDRAFYGATSTYGYSTVAQYDGGAASTTGLLQLVLDVGGSPIRLWAGTSDGLWATTDLASTQPKVRRPVVVVPGIMGSWPTPQSVAQFAAQHAQALATNAYETDLTLDPYDHTYDPTLNYLRAQGYIDGQTLFTFPYQWRQDNDISGKQLGQLIRDIRLRCGCSQVDVIAHSMGGLVARSYVQGSFYQNDVRNLIQIGTPNLGAAEAYMRWEAAQFPGGDLKTKLARVVFQLEAYVHGSPTLTDYIRCCVLSVGQLLPIFNYLQGRSYPIGYPHNSYLERLNSASLLSLLHQKVSIYEFGSDSWPTLQSLVVGPVNPEATHWPDGEIQASSYGPGDGTVLRSSQESLMPITTTAGATHGGLMGDPGTLRQIATVLLGGYRSVSPVASPLPQPLTVITATNASALVVTDSRGHDLSGYVMGDWGVGYGYAVLPNSLASNLSISALPTEGSIAQLQRYELQPGSVDQLTVPVASWQQANMPPQNLPIKSVSDVSNTTILNTLFSLPKPRHFWLDFQTFALPEMANIDSLQRQYVHHRHGAKKRRPKPHPHPWKWLLIGLSVPVGLGWLAVRRDRTRGPT